MARTQNSVSRNALKAEVKQILAEDQDLLKAMAAATLQQTLEAEIDEALAAEKSERTAGRLGYRSGYYGRALITRIGKNRTAGAAGSAGPIPDRSVRAVPAERESAGDGHDGNVLTGRVHAQSKGSDRRALRARVQFGRGQPHCLATGRGTGEVRAQTSRRRLTHSFASQCRHRIEPHRSHRGNQASQQGGQHKGNRRCRQRDRVGRCYVDQL